MKNILIVFIFFCSIHTATAACTNSGDDTDGYGTLWTTAKAGAGSTVTEVQECVDAASNGDTIQIPNGTATWTTGINSTKQIIIRAQNYTATPAGNTGASSFTHRTGATSRNVTITADLTQDSVFDLQTGDDYHVGVGGIAFDANNKNSNGIVRVTGSGSKPALIFDLYVYNLECQHGSSTDDDRRYFEVRGTSAVFWNLVVAGSCTTSVGDGLMIVEQQALWESNGTMGMDDTSGTTNVYVEDSTFEDTALIPDIDNGGRIVVRYCTLDGVWGETHGFTSIKTGRHWEYYDIHFLATTSQRNLSNRYFWCRGGTGVFTDNRVDEEIDTGSYGGTPVQINIGDTTSPGSYPMNMQPGYGWEDGSHVSDPIYIWNQYGDLGYDYGFSNGWDSIVVVGRDIIVNDGAKPEYSKYTYPHPLRNDIEEQETPVPANAIQGMQISNLGVTKNLIAWHRTDGLR